MIIINKKKSKRAFKSNCIEFESKWGKYKTLSVKENLNVIRPYLNNIINDHKTQGEWKVHSRNTITDYTDQGEWKIQLIMIINFKPKDSDEIRTMHTKSNDIEIMIGNKTE